VTTPPTHPTPSPVLALTDFSEAAQAATRRAALVARAEGRPLLLMHALGAELLAGLRRWMGERSAVEGSLRQAAAQQLDEAAAALAADTGAPVSTRLLDLGEADTSTPAALSAAAEAADAACVVVGARGASPWRRLVLGSTAERLLRACHRPLLVVRNPAPGPYRRVLVGVDHSAWCRPALAAARTIAPGAEIVLVAVFEVPFGEKLRFAGVDDAAIAHYRRMAQIEAHQAVETLAAEAALPPGRWRAVVVEGDAARGLIEQAESLDCDLLVLGKHGRSATEDLLLGSVTQHVLAECRRDVLVSTAREDTPRA
jgi:nucleotide-binding universal stress UspA family protein